MIKIDHIAVYVHELETVKDFFIRFFSARANTMYHNPRTGLRSYFLSFDDDSRLEIMSRPEVGQIERDVYRAGYTHLSFSVGSKEEVDRITNRLKEYGYEILSGPRFTGDGYYESAVLGPEDNIIEITE